GGDRLHSLAEGVEPRVLIFPWIDKRLSVECHDCAANVFQFQSARSFGNQQANAELNRRHVFDEVLVVQHGEQIEIARHRGPGREWYKRWMKGHAEFAKFANY